MKRYLSFLYILLMAVVMLPMVSCSGEDTDEETGQVSVKKERNFIRSGNEAYNDKRYGDAEAEYKKALEVNPHSEKAYFNLASALLLQEPSLNQKTDEASMQQQQQALQQQQQGQQGQDSLTQAQQERIQKIVEIFQQVAQDSIARNLAAKACYDMGNISFRQFNYQQALECYKQALRFSPKYENARYNLRMTQLRMKNDKNNQDKNQNKQDKDKQKQDQQKQDQQKQQQEKQNQDKQNQQNQQNQQQQQQQQPKKGEMDEQSMEQILRAMQNQENAAQQRVKAAQEAQKQGERERTRNKW